ncbi:MAG: hypothetical protein MUF77_07810 [Leptospira sp.]|nr:hypothetical protein [Leptospira sp.]
MKKTLRSSYVVKGKNLPTPDGDWPAEYKKAVMEMNRAWIKKAMAEGAIIYDVGTDPNRFKRNEKEKKSSYYAMEKAEIRRNNYPTRKIELTPYEEKVSHEWRAGNKK